MGRKRRQELIKDEAVNIELLSEEAIPASTIKTTQFIKPLNVHQRLFVKSIKQNVYTVSQGPAGVGKSLLALFTAVQLLNNEDSSIERILYIRANVEDDDEKDIGFLPGTQNEKLKPLAYPVLDNLILFTREADAHYLVDSGKIEVLPMFMLRGRSLNNTFIIVDEAQNCTPKQMKTLLTRLGQGSKMVIMGDPGQIDSRKCFHTNGLVDLCNKLEYKLDQRETDEENRPAVNVIKFTKEDIVRHPAVKWFLDLYEE